MTYVYRYYDQSELERQLNARATVPDITPILMPYASESARMRSGLPSRLGVSYGSSRCDDGGRGNPAGNELCDRTKLSLVFYLRRVVDDRLRVHPFGIIPCVTDDAVYRDPKGKPIIGISVSPASQDDGRT